MSNDMRKSVALRCFLWLVAAVTVMVAVIFADILLDMLPIWYGPGPHHWIEASVFWGVVGPAIWRWLSRRVWVGTAAATSALSGGVDK